MEKPNLLRFWSKNFSVGQEKWPENIHISLTIPVIWWFTKIPMVRKYQTSVKQTNTDHITKQITPKLQVANKKQNKNNNNKIHTELAESMNHLWFPTSLELLFETLPDHQLDVEDFSEMDGAYGSMEKRENIRNPPRYIWTLACEICRTEIHWVKIDLGFSYLTS